MTKNITICFRTSDGLRKALEKISEQERRSVSSTIENILYAYLKDGKALKQAKEERRRYPRKALDAPALISGLTPDSKDLSAGIVSNISLGGLQVSIPSNYQYELEEEKENARISIVFTVPQSKKPLSVQCVPQHVSCIGGETNIGASFCDSDFACYQTIQNYLIN
jgi:hypothetical protein